ncbi:MAG: hypothetical protein GEV28_28435 [Actinophytocola sp.]|uniref:transposase family protein n=1 Tax=Actinophytocola sp. TaxID=1872138 RepID=UPI001321A820|nr:transposase family protein [Actinophytocola sp.]MPZ84113.1 hypothetical protein [Actinophytocola sp.]
MPDPRKKRGVRHRFSAILFVSVCAVVSGARSFATIAEWAADAVEDTLRGMGIGAPNASTVRRALSTRSTISPTLSGTAGPTTAPAARSPAPTRSSPSPPGSCSRTPPNPSSHPHPQAQARLPTRQARDRVRDHLTDRRTSPDQPAPPGRSHQHRKSTAPQRTKAETSRQTDLDQLRSDFASALRRRP